MTIQTRKSALAIKEETTEGTPVKPAAATDYIALQDDISMSPSFNVLENSEIKDSLGRSKSILGIESPTFSMSHYLTHSGTEGTTPSYRLFLKSVFGGEDDAGVEHDTVSGSTTSVINVASGEGATYRKGQALLIKDSTNGYSIRPIKSISTDALTLGFNVTTAPGTGVNLGEAITYYPVNDNSHAPLSVWHYLGNGGVTQMMAGSKVDSVSIAVTAGELISVNYSLSGLSYYFNPIEITASNKYLDFEVNSTDFNAEIKTGIYKDPHALAEAIQDAMVAVNTVGAATITAVYSDTTGKFTIAGSGATTFKLEWSTGSNTANTIGGDIGFTTSADDTGALTYTSDNAISFASPQTPSITTVDPLSAKHNEILIGDAADTVCFEAQSLNFSISNSRSFIDSICSKTGRKESVASSRQVTLSVTSVLDKYDVDKFTRFRKNTETSFVYNFGVKDSFNNWKAGKSGCLYLPQSTITSFNLVDNEGLVGLNLELSAYVTTDNPEEVFLSFV